MLNEVSQSLFIQIFFKFKLSETHSNSKKLCGLFFN